MEQNSYIENHLKEYHSFYDQITHVKKDWEQFVATGNIDLVTTVRPEVLSSWQRSYEMGINPYSVKTDLPGYSLTSREVTERLAANRTFLEIATPLLDVFVANLDSFFRLDFYDKDLFLLKQFGELEALQLNKYTKVGVNKAEEIAGTNAVALAYILKKPIQLTGPEHYFDRAHSVTCSAVPIFTNDGDIQGILNIYGPFEKVQSHNLGMVIALTQAIKLSYLQYDLLQEKELAFQYSENIVNSISDGLIALDANGYFTSINRNASEILEINPDEAIGRSARDYFNPDSTILDTLNTGSSVYDRELIFTINNKRKVVVGNCLPIVHANQGKGVLSIFKDSIRARSIIKNLAGFKAHFTFDDLIGQSLPFANIKRLATHAAPLPSHVLILGESGTGKELFAQSIHNASYFHNGPFIGVNCAAMPVGLIESELFGYEGGAFTGGKREGQPGKFALAEGGTLFLDEIDSLSIANQATLLRVLQSQRYTRVGGNTELSFNARLIVASNRNLWKEVQAGSFRQDLFYRINVLSLEIPPLRERKDDLRELALYFSKKCVERINFHFTISEDALELMASYSWPGNVRELENMIERCAIMANSNGMNCIDRQLLLSQGIGWPNENENEYKATFTNALCLETVEKQTIERVLIQEQNNISKAAKSLGITRKTLYEKIKKYQIDTK